MSRTTLRFVLVHWILNRGSDLYLSVAMVNPSNGGPLMMAYELNSERTYSGFLGLKTQELICSEVFEPAFKHAKNILILIVPPYSPCVQGAHVVFNKP